ncbi:hypothetical protein ACIRRX_14675 [Streptomyces bacillaris]
MAEPFDPSLALLTVEEAARRLRRVPADALPAYVAKLRHRPAYAA